jgi:hypothetical protein
MLKWLSGCFRDFLTGYLRADRLTRQTRRSSDPQLVVIPRWSNPIPSQSRQPVIASPERIHESANGEPVPVSRARFHAPRLMLQVPPQVLDMPLVRPDLPATPDHLGGVFCTNDMLVNGGRIEPRQTSREQLPRFLGRYLLIRWPSHYRAEPT